MHERERREPSRRVPEGRGEQGRQFSLSFGPTTRKNDNGTTTDFEGSITGTLNKARTKATGKWSFKGTDHDAAGAVTDTCDSAKVSWTAKA